MSNTLKHKFTSGKSDGVDTTLIRPSNWNDEHVFAGGSDGNVLIYSTAATDKVAWTATPSLTSVTLAAGSAAAASVAVGAANTGLYSSGVGALDITVSAARLAAFTDGALYLKGYLNVALDGLGGSAVFLVPYTHTLQLGANQNGSPNHQVLKAHNGITGTNVAGANLTLAAGSGTGTGAPGQLLFQVAPKKASGTDAQVLATALTISDAGTGGTAAPLITFAGGEQHAYRGITSLRTLDASDYFIDCTANTFTVTLPTAVGCTGRTYIIKNSGTGTITIDTTSSQTIDGETSIVLNVQNQSITVVSDNANWKVT